MNLSKNVAYIHADFQPDCLTKHPKVSNRDCLVHELIKCYGLLDYVKVIPPKQATEMELKSFHSEEYINFLQTVNKLSEDEFDSIWDDSQEFGLGYDNPLISHLYDLVAITGGATITATEVLMSGSYKIAVNWNGGWHHAKRDEASGFCYINDIVLGILLLLKQFQRVLYIDLDLHHGDGVQDAFLYTNRVLCFSVHKYEPGFFPGSGSIDDVGQGRGKFYTVNVPLYSGINDDQFAQLLIPLLNKTYANFKPDVVVCQCGADTLADDPMESFNLTLKSIGECVKAIMSWSVPLILLGGGGYNFPNTARLWTYLLSLGVSKTLAPDIPEHTYLMSYGPDYELHIESKRLYNYNSDDYIKSLFETVLGNLDRIV